MRSLLEAAVWLLAGAVILLAVSKMGHAEKPSCASTPGLAGTLSLSLSHYPDDTRMTMVAPETDWEYRRYLWGGFAPGDEFVAEPTYYPCAISSGQLASFQLWYDMTELELMDAGAWVYIGSTVNQRYGYLALQMAFSDTQRHFLPALRFRVLDPNVRGDALWTASNVGGAFVADWHVLAIGPRDADPCWMDTDGDGAVGVADYLAVARSFAKVCEER